MFVHEDWSGSCFDLCVGLGTPDECRLSAAYSRLWAFRHLTGAWPERAQVGGVHHRHNPPPTPRISRGGAEEWLLLHGLLGLDGTHVVGCIVFACRQDTDKLCLSVPIGMLDRLGATYPYEHSDPVVEQLVQRLAEAADWVCQSVPFDVALIGEEVDGVEELAKEVGWLQEWRDLLLSQSLCDRLALSGEPRRLSSGLCWYARG